MYKRINVAQTFCQHYDASSSTFFDVIVTLAFRSEYSKATRYVLLDFVKGLNGLTDSRKRTKKKPQGVKIDYFKN